MGQFDIEQRTLEGWQAGGPLDMSANIAAQAIGKGMALLDRVHIIREGHLGTRLPGDNSVTGPGSGEESTLEIIVGVAELVADRARKLGRGISELWHGLGSLY